MNKGIFTYEQSPWIDYMEIDEKTGDYKLKDDAPEDVKQAYKKYLESREKL